MFSRVEAGPFKVPGLVFCATIQHQYCACGALPAIRLVIDPQGFCDSLLHWPRAFCIHNRKFKSRDRHRIRY